MISFALKYALIALALLVVVGALWWAAKRPHRSRRHPGRLRMPLFVPAAGVVLIAIAFLLGLIAFTSRFTAELLPMRVASVIAALVGIGCLVAYRNWYVDARAAEVRFRTVLGRERVIAYADIVDHRMLRRAGHPVLVVRSSQGVRLRLDLTIYPVEPLVAAVRARG